MDNIKKVLYFGFKRVTENEIIFKITDVESLEEKEFYTKVLENPFSFQDIEREFGSKDEYIIVIDDNGIGLLYREMLSIFGFLVIGNSVAKKIQSMNL